MRLPVRTGLLVVLVAAVVVPLALAVSGGDMITTIAGTGTAGFTGDGGQATSAQLSSPFGVAVDAQGDFYIADAGNNRVRKVSGGVITTVAGTGTPGYSGDGGQATSAQLQFPSDVAVDGQGNLYIADYENQRIRKVSGGIITTVAGTGALGYSGDGGQATSAQINFPQGVAVDAQGNLYIADTSNYRVRKVTGGIITTVAGNGAFGFSGDGGQATSAQLNYPIDVAVDGQGNLFVADYNNHRIRKVSGGVITTVAGKGPPGGFSGDGGQATSAQLNYPYSIAFDAAGNLYIADYNNNRVRKVAGGIITTLTGNGTPTFSGDGGPASSAQVRPIGVAVGPDGSLVVTDYGKSACAQDREQASVGVDRRVAVVG